EVADRRERLNLVRKWTGGVGADIACDFVGFPQVIAEGIEMLRSGGTYLEIGTISRGAKVELEPSLLVWGSKTIVGVIQYDPGTIPRALDFLVRNRVRWLALRPAHLAHVSAREHQSGLRRLRVAREGDHEHHPRRARALTGRAPSDFFHSSRAGGPVGSSVH